MKKKIGLGLIALLIVLLQVSVVYAVTTDTEGPTVSKLSFATKKDAYSVGDKIYLSTDMKDAISGIDTVQIWVNRFNVNDGTYVNNFEEVRQSLIVQFDEKNSPYVVIPDTYIGGTYYVREIDMFDKEGNRSWFYTADQLTYFHEWYNYLKENMYLVEGTDFDTWVDSMTGNYEPVRTNISLKFNVVLEAEDTEAPFISAFQMGDAKVNYSDIYHFSLKVSDNTHKMNVSVGLSDGSSIQQDIDDRTSSIVTFSYNPALTKTTGKVQIDYVILTDIYGNVGFYIRDDYTGNLAVDWYKKICKTCESLRDDLVFEVIDDGSRDEEKPVLKDVKINKTEFPIPSFAKVELMATDNKKLANEATVIFKSGKKELMAILHLDSDNVYRGELEINQYADIGEYKLTDVVIGDAAGNGVLYCNYDQKYKDEDLKIDLGFKLTSKFTPDVVTSTSDREILDKISQAKDDAIIAVDATGNPLVQKYVFEEIQGTNKTLVIEANGIEWVFNGKDIKALKDIDTSLSVYYDYNYSELDSSKYLEKALFLDFADNGELPGIATVRIKLDYALRDYIGEEVYVYYYDKDDKENKLLSDILGSSITLNDNGWFEFKINHNSTYVLTNKKPNEKYVKEDKTLIEANEEFVGKEEKKNKIKLSYFIAGAVVGFALVGVVVFILQKRSKKVLK